MNTQYGEQHEKNNLPTPMISFPPSNQQIQKDGCKDELGSTSSGKFHAFMIRLSLFVLTLYMDSISIIDFDDRMRRA